MPDELEEYARFLGIDPELDKDFMYIAKQGIMAPVPEPWQIIKDESDTI